MKSIMITSVGGLGKQIAEAIRLSSHNYFIVGTDLRRCFYEEGLINRFYQSLRADDPQFLPRTEQIIVENNVGIIFVGSIPETRWFAQNKEYFESKGVQAIVSDPNIFDLCMDKCTLSDYLTERGILLPKYKRVTHISDIEGIDFFPLVLKPNKDASGSNNVTIIFDKEELKLFTNYYLRRNVEMIAQEWIENSSNEYSVNLTIDGDQVLGNIAINRNFSTALSVKEKFSHNGTLYCVSSGISQGKIVIHHGLEKETNKIARALGISGSLNLQGIFRDDHFYLIDLHPAITGSVYAKALAGYNEPLHYIKKYINAKEDAEFNVREVEIVRTLKTEVI